MFGPKANMNTRHRGSLCIEEREREDVRGRRAGAGRGPSPRGHGFLALPQPQGGALRTHAPGETDRQREAPQPSSPTSASHPTTGS